MDRKLVLQTARKDAKKHLRARSPAELRLLLLWSSLKAILQCVVNYLKYLWQHNPLKIFNQRQRRLYFVESYGEVMIKPKFKERVMDVFLSDYRRRKRLLKWVNKRLINCEVTDFCTCWQDGIMLCALLESICPGVCPSYHLLSQHNLVKNCRLGLKLANKYLYLPMDLLSPEEMAIATTSSEHKIIQYISMLKWASENIKEKWSSLHESLIAAKTGRCFAKGSGLRNGIVSKRSKFTIIVSDIIGVFNLLVEVRGPNNEYCGERIVSLHQAKGVLDKSFDMNNSYSDTIKYLEDGVGNTFVRKKVPARYAIDQHGDLIHLEFQCGEEGTFYVTFVPRRAGMHTVAVKWQNHHVESSPFRVKVFKASNVSTKNLNGAQEKRVIYDSLSFTTYTGSSVDSQGNSEDGKDDNLIGPMAVRDVDRSMSAIAKSKAYCMGRQLTVTRRRVLRRIITRNGEDIVIEEAISPSISRQSSITDNTSDEDNRHQRKDESRLSPNMSKSPLSSSSMPQNITTKHPPTGLGTVMEERQFSKDDSVPNTIANIAKQLCEKKESGEVNAPMTTLAEEEENTSDANNHKTITASRLTYKCTEINEHNILDQQTTNEGQHQGETCSQNNDACTSSSKPTYSFGDREHKDDGLDTKAAVLEKRSPLRRTMSIHTPEKPKARRTTSDGPIYKMRKSLVSFASREKSTDSSEQSSDDRQSAGEDDQDDQRFANPALKLLHSSSMKKACMYISGKALNQTVSSSIGEDDVFCDVAIPEKSRLRATQSLPIMRKMWTRDEENAPIKELKHILEKIESESSCAPSSLYSESGPNDNSEWPNSSFDIPTYTNTDRDSEKQVLLPNEMCPSSENHVLSQNAIILPREKEPPMLYGYYFFPNHGKDADVNQRDVLTVKDIPLTMTLSSIKQTHSSNNADVQNVNKNQQNNTNKERINNSEPLSDNIAATEDFSNQCVAYSNIESTVNEKSHGIFTKPANRGNLTRQFTVLGQKSSGESSSDNEKIKDDAKHTKSLDESLSDAELQSELEQTDIRIKTRVFNDQNVRVDLERNDTSSSEERHIDTHNRKPEFGGNIIGRRKDKSSDNQNLNLTEFERKNSFKSISLQSSPGKRSKYTTKASIVVPKPKVDKSTQVCDSEIKTETGWDVIEGAYLLMRRISVKMPYLSTTYINLNDVLHQDRNTSDIKEIKRESEVDVKIENASVEGENNDKLSVPFVVNVNVEHPVNVDRMNDLGATSGGDNIENIGICETLGIGSHENVDAWFKRNENMLNNRQSLAPVRQYTIETIDSGFDDNPTHYNRHARCSLPSLISGNGHVRLYRRMYQGQIPLDPKLVNSASSQSISVERRELGNEADDERMNNSIADDKANRQQTRRHRLQYRDESFSLSDPELNQRKRTTIKKRHFVNRKIPLRVNKMEKTFRVNSQSFSKLVENEQLTKQSGNVINRGNDTNNSFEGTDDVHSKHSKRTYTMDLNKDFPLPSWKIHSSTNTSSLESTYCGFGVSKAGRINLLSYLGEFQDLYPTEERDEHDANDEVTSMEKPNAISKEVDNSLGSHTDNILKTHSASSLIHETDDAFPYVKEKRSKSWDGVLDDYSYNRFAADGDKDMQDDEDALDTNESSNKSQNETDSISEDLDVPHTHHDTFDIFSSFDYSHLNDILPRQANARLSEEEEQKKEEEQSNLKEDEQQTRVHVAGVGLQYGQVGASNSFQVWTENPSNDSLSVNVIGPRSHTVTETSIIYTGDNLYEVSYEVTQPGFYKIFIKWGDTVVAKSPYICEVSL